MASEPEVVLEDVQRVLRQVIRPDSPDEGEAVLRVAERAATSARTVYRVLNPPAAKKGDPFPARIKLDLADRLVMAAGRQLAEINCRVVLDDQVVEYGDA